MLPVPGLLCLHRALSRWLLFLWWQMLLFLQTSTSAVLTKEGRRTKVFCLQALYFYSGGNALHKDFIHTLLCIFHGQSPLGDWIFLVGYTVAPNETVILFDRKKWNGYWQSTGNVCPRHDPCVQAVLIWCFSEQ